MSRSVIDIPVEVQSAAVSGRKHVTPQGTSAVKDGMKSTSMYGQVGHLPKPDWLRVTLNYSEQYKKLQGIVKQHQLSTVCEEAHCPNINECWSAGTATVMLMGSVCTRACQFCAVDTGNPKGWLDKDEPDKVADLVEKMALKYVVLTSVNRDDLADGGAGHYAQAVRAIKARCPKTAVEVLTPDFKGDHAAVRTLVDSGIAVFAQNVETVKRLTHPIRDPRASYEQTLDVLGYAKHYKTSCITKTSLLLGLGETEDEIKTAMDDLREVNVDILTLGQYLRPTLHHHPVKRYVTPDEFKRYRQWGLARGFTEVVSGAMVRSSYRAERALAKNNANIDD